MDKCCLVSRVVSSTVVKIAGLSCLSSPRPGQVLFGLLLSSCPRWTCFWFCRRGLTCQVREVCVFGNSTLFDFWRVHWRKTLCFVFCCKRVQCTCNTLAYMSLMESTYTRDVVHGWVGLRHYWRVHLLFKWNRRLIHDHCHFEFLPFPSKSSLFLYSRFCDFLFVHPLQSSRHSFSDNVFISFWIHHWHGWKWL